MKSLVQYAALRLGVGLVGLLPGSLARRLGSDLGKIWYRFAGSRRIMAQRHLERATGGQADPDDARKVFASYGRYWAEALWVRPRRVGDIHSRTTVSGLEKILEARDAGKGMIFALPHMGNWEAAAPVAVMESIPLVAVAENLPNRWITSWFTRLRAQFGIEIVLATGSAAVMRQLETAIAANKAVALVSDRDLRGRGVEVEFFGEKTTLPPGPAALAERTGAPLFPAATYFSDGGHHVVVTPPLAPPRGEDRSERIRQLTQELAARLEDLIKARPEQWHLVQPNWPSDRLL